MSAETAPPSEPAAATRRCQNCGSDLLGEHCYACGQPTKGLVRHFSSIIGDFMDSVIGLDSRILRTIGPLLFKPGFLSEEYFAGRRVRYVSPVRLFVFMSILAFFAAQFSFNIDADDPGAVVIDDAPPAGVNLMSATTVAEVEKIRDAALDELRKGREQAAGVPGVAVGLDVAERAVIADAARRIAQIEESGRTGKPLPMVQDNEGDISFNGEPWDPVSNPIDIGWLPDAVNDKLNAQAGRAKGNIKRIQEDPNLLKDAFLSTVPTTLFVLLPLFALLLKVVYLFKRRLYMEHLIVALHSHSFLCASLLVVLLLDAMAGWASGLPPLASAVGALEVALLVWMPAYLLLMQKRVYRQGWIMTVFKYGLLGTLYSLLLSLGAVASVMVSLVSL